MNDQHPYRSTIPVVGPEHTRPLWSVMIPSYNCAHYLRETLAAVLAQDPGPDLMQIEVVDDCSTQDDPAAVVAEVGQGRVGFYRQPQNVGHIRNFATCLKRTRGRLIHLLHGDDVVLDGFYRTLERGFTEHPTIGAAFCRHIFIDERGEWIYTSKPEQPESGVLKNWLERIASRQCIQTPSIVVRREVYEHLGGFDQRIKYCGEDWEMWVRIALHYPVWYEVEPLALYRTSSSSLTGRSMSTGENIRDSRRAIEIYQSYLPATSAVELTNQAREFVALWALKNARLMLEAGDPIGACAQLREAFNSHRSIRVAREAAGFLRWSATRWIGRKQK